MKIGTGRPCSCAHGARASEVLALQTCQQYQQQHQFIGVDFFGSELRNLACSVRFRLRSCSHATVAVFQKQQASPLQQESVIVTKPRDTDADGGRVGTLDSLRVWVRGEPEREMNGSGTLCNLATLFHFPFRCIRVSIRV
jgi:hypothetical protein